LSLANQSEQLTRLLCGITLYQLLRGQAVHLVLLPLLCKLERLKLIGCLEEMQAHQLVPLVLMRFLVKFHLRQLHLEPQGLAVLCGTLALLLLILLQIIHQQLLLQAMAERQLELGELWDVLWLLLNLNRVITPLLSGFASHKGQS